MSRDHYIRDQEKISMAPAERWNANSWSVTIFSDIKRECSNTFIILSVRRTARGSTVCWLNLHRAKTCCRHLLLQRGRGKKKRMTDRSVPKQAKVALLVTEFYSSTFSFIILWEFLIFYQIFLSPQVKWCAIITYKHGIYELPQELPNDFRLRILVN